MRMEQKEKLENLSSNDENNFYEKKLALAKTQFWRQIVKFWRKLKIYGYAAKLKKLFAQNSKNELAAKFKYINEF